MRESKLLAVAFAGLLALPAFAACPETPSVAAYVADFAAARKSAGFGKDLTPADAVCARAALIGQLPAVQGERVGYKAVFTNPDSQRRFGVSGPAWGAMFGKLMLADGARLPAKFGALSRYESDFVVVVKDAGLADARTPEEALAHIEALEPFIELPDIMLDKPTGLELVATNAAFRGGVLGARIPVDAANAPALAAALADMDVVITEDRSGREIGREKGRVLMDNPLNAAIWLAQALRSDGIVLKPGDLLSLGGFLASAPTQAGTTITVRYRGLPGDPAVTVHFD